MCLVIGCWAEVLCNQLENLNRTLTHGYPPHEHFPDRNPEDTDANFGNGFGLQPPKGFEEYPTCLFLGEI